MHLLMAKHFTVYETVLPKQSNKQWQQQKTQLNLLNPVAGTVEDRGPCQTILWGYNEKKSRMWDVLQDKQLGFFNK